MVNKPKRIIVHHDGVSRKGPSLHIVNQAHKQRTFPISKLGWYVGYHWVIEKDGTFARTRYDDEIGAHTIGQNDCSIGIFLAGNFDKELPTKAQEVSLGMLLQHYTRLYNIDESEIGPHRWYSNKTCYGSKLPDHWAAVVWLTFEVEQYQARIALMNDV